MKFVFFYPSQILGGAELLFARLAMHLRQQGHEVLLVDVQGGKLSQLLAGQDVEVIVAVRGQPVLLQDAVLITPSSHVMEVRRWIRPHVSLRCVFWTIHPYNNRIFPPYLTGLLSTHPRLLYAVNRIFLGHEFAERRASLEWLMANGGLVFMDDECYRQTQEWYGLPASLPPVYLPIPLPEKTASTPPRPLRDDDLRLVWIGRLVDFKVHSLLFLAQQLAASAMARRVTLVIVGTGDEAVATLDKVRALGLKLDIRGEMSPDDLCRLLETEADLVVAMGTSALEGARLGIPTVLIDASYSPIQNGYRFRWLYQTRGFCLGRVLENGRDYSDEGMAIGELLQRLPAEGAREGERCLAYFRESHEMAGVAARLEALAATAPGAGDFAARYPFRDGWAKRGLKFLLGRASS